MVIALLAHWKWKSFSLFHWPESADILMKKHSDLVPVKRRVRAANGFLERFMYGKETNKPSSPVHYSSLFFSRFVFDSRKCFFYYLKSYFFCLHCKSGKCTFPSLEQQSTRLFRKNSNSPTIFYFSVLSYISNRQRWTKTVDDYDKYA